MKESPTPDPNVEQDRIKQFYDSSYYALEQAPVSTTHHLRKLARRLGLQPGTRILDIACGRGDWLLAASEMGCEVAGIDLSDRAVTLCHAAVPRADVRQGNAESLPWPEAHFDLVTCLGSLEHFLDPVAAIREMARVSTPAARFVLLVPNSGFLTRRLGIYRGTGQTQAREVVRSLDAWSRVFEEAGLRVDSRWRDLHVLSARWIMQNGWTATIPRALQALALAIWPLSFQYQVYHLCRRV